MPADTLSNNTAFYQTNYPEIDRAKRDFAELRISGQDEMYQH
jgi:hypothetical protein